MCVHLFVSGHRPGGIPLPIFLTLLCPPQVKDVVDTWRVRLPNNWDQLPAWSAVLQWRNHVHTFIIKAFDVSDGALWRVDRPLGG